MTLIKNFFQKGNPRTIKAKKNIAASIGLRAISILVSLQIVPITINYINPTQYGIWLTLSSIVAWISYFDLGFANGFRNKFAEAKAIGDMKMAKCYVSTTYAILSILFSFIFLIIFVVNRYLNWSSILNIDISYNEELKIVFAILACFFCINIVASIFTTMLTADQRPALAALIQTCGQVLAFVSILILTHTTEGSLTKLAFIFSGVPCILLVVISIITFSRKKYKEIRPSISHVQFGLSRNIIGLGSQFFIIMISMLVIFQFINIMLSRIQGPEAVTQYNIAYKYFNVINMGISIILTPFWSAFTEAYTQKDFAWMKSTQHKLEKLSLICIPIYTLMIIISSTFYKFWIGESIHIPLSLTITMATYSFAQSYGNIYMYLINGIGKVRLQLIIYFTFALISVPIMYICCKMWGIEGILILPIIIFTTQSIIGRIQLNKIISNNAIGIWDK